MTRMALGDRIRTVAVTAVLTSAGWLAFGGTVLRDAGGLFTIRHESAPSPAAPAVSSAPDRAPASPRKAERLHKITIAPAPALAAGDYLLPVAGVRPEQLTDTFTQSRDGGARVHEAIDILAPTGTPVLAAVAGKVEKLFTSKAGGLTIYIRSPDLRTITYYAHLNAYAPGLAEGQQVRQGQEIATVGFSGNANPAAPHLHFAIMQTTADSAWWEPSVAVNPFPLLTRKRS